MGVHTRYHNHTLPEIIRELEVIDERIPRERHTNSSREKLHDAITELSGRMNDWKDAFTFGDNQDD